jgi:hypothetical protein
MGPFLYTFDEEPDHEYSVDNSGHDCGTVACIAGHAVLIDHNVNAEPTYEEAQKLMNTAFLGEARQILGLDYDTAYELFFAREAPISRHRIKSDQAVRTLRHLAETGEVDWTV